MRLAIRHEVTFSFASPQKSILQILRLQPRPCESQSLSVWRITTNWDCSLTATEDAYFNAAHTLQADGPLTDLKIVSEGIAHTFDASGVVRNTIEHFIPQFYLRESGLTASSGALRSFAQEAALQGGTTLDALHLLMRALHETTDFTPNDTFGRPALEIFESKQGNAFELAQCFIAGARALNIPSRCVSGYVFRTLTEQNEVYAAFHGWAESYVENIGWIAFDPAFCICADQSYVRLACGLDALDVQPIRGVLPAGATKKHRVKIAATIEPAISFMQQQSQSQI